jgi:hypothetical protein
MEEVAISKLIEGKKTYPSWTTGRVYPLKTRTINDKCLVYYEPKGRVKRRIERVFPEKIALSSRFIWTLGFLKGEGSNALGKSNYRRFTITNTDARCLKIVIAELEKSELWKKEQLSNTGVNILHAKKDELETREFWAKGLAIPLEKIKYYKTSERTSEFGVCHIYISDVLLRRVFDEINEFVMRKKGGVASPIAGSGFEPLTSTCASISLTPSVGHSTRSVYEPSEAAGLCYTGHS